MPLYRLRELAAHMLPNSPFTAQAAVVRPSKNAPARAGMTYALNIVNLRPGYPARSGPCRTSLPNSENYAKALDRHRPVALASARGRRDNVRETRPCTHKSEIGKQRLVTVRFTPDSGHSSVQVGCPLCANSRHSPRASGELSPPRFVEPKRCRTAPGTTMRRR